MGEPKLFHLEKDNFLDVKLFGKTAGVWRRLPPP